MVSFVSWNGNLFRCPYILGVKRNQALGSIDGECPLGLHP